MILARIARKLAAFLFGDYELYRVYAWEPGAGPPRPPPDGIRLGPLEDGQELSRSPEPALAALASYAGEGARGFGAWVAGELASACWYWSGERYLGRGFWPLGPDEAKLVQIVTSPAARGRGLAIALIGWSATAMSESGHRRLFARIWHSNRPSIRAFEQAGWRYVAFVVGIAPFHGKRRFRLRFRRGGFRLWTLVVFPGVFGCR